MCRIAWKGLDGPILSMSVQSFVFSAYVMCAVLKKGNWISLPLFSLVWNMEAQPEMVFEENAATRLQERVLIDNLFDLYWMLLEVYIQKKFFAAWSGNTRRRSSES